MKIGEVARGAGVSIDTVRFYERIGVLPRAPRTASGYRDYPEGTTTRLRMVKQLQGVGLTLEEIVDALAAHDTGRATCATQRWRLDAALARIDDRLGELRAVRREIVRAQSDCDGGHCRFGG